MPGARTYQAIGFTTYQGGRLYARKKAPELRRQAAFAGGTALVLVALTGAAVAVSRRRSRPATV